MKNKKTHFLFVLLSLLLFTGVECPKGDAIPSDVKNPNDPIVIAEKPVNTTVDDISSPVTTEQKMITWKVTNSEFVTGFLIRQNTSRVYSLDHNQRTYTLDSLDDSTNIVSVRALYSSSNTLESEKMGVNSKTFNVNAISGVALMVYPRKMMVGVGQQFTLQLRVKNVTSLQGLNVRLSHETGGFIELKSVGKGTLTSKNNGDAQFPPFTTSTSGQYDISSFIIGGTPNGVSGNGDIVLLVFNALKKGYVNISIENNNTFYIDTSNKRQNFATVRSGSIQIQ